MLHPTIFKDYKKGDTVEYLLYRDPDTWRQAEVIYVGESSCVVKSLASGLVTEQVFGNMRRSLESESPTPFAPDTATP